MGLFDKKFCDFCGEKIKLLGNRKLEDGNMCKSCASLLSPWFSERRSSTVEEIREQLKYREENKENVAAFNASAVYGDETKVIIDEGKGRLIVSSAKNWKEANPDVIDASQILGCEIEIEEGKNEIQFKTADGKYEGFVPKKYAHFYDFSIKINVNHPYFNEMVFKLNRSRIDNDAETRLNNRTAGVGLTISNAAQVRSSAEYRKYDQMANEIKAAVMKLRQEVKEAAVPKKAVICQCCGATTIPDANGCCEYCGGAAE